MPLRTRIARTLVATAIVCVAFVAVGVTAPAEGPFTIDVEPVFLLLDPTAIAGSRADALGLNVDIKFGTLHLHLRWSAIPLTPATTKSIAPLL